MRGSVRAIGDRLLGLLAPQVRASAVTCQYVYCGCSGQWEYWRKVVVGSGNPCHGCKALDYC